MITLGNYGLDEYLAHVEQSKKKLEQRLLKKPIQAQRLNYEERIELSARIRRIHNISAKKAISWDAKINSRKLREFL